MLRIFYGTDRKSAEDEAKKLLGKGYEVVDGESLDTSEFSPIFLGASLFTTDRKILIKSLLAKKENAEELEKYLDTKNTVILIENSLNGTWTAVKNIKKNPNVEVKEFKLPENNANRFVSFKIYDLAMENSKSAYDLLKKNEETEDPYMMLGSFASTAIKNYSNRKTTKGKRIIKELARLDKLMKTTKFSDDPWLLLETFVLRAKTL